MKHAVCPMVAERLNALGLVMMHRSPHAVPNSTRGVKILPKVT